MTAWRAAVVLGLLTACAGPAGTPRPAEAPRPGQAEANLSFVCPDRITTVVTFQSGAKRRWDWRGADPANPNVCLIDTGAARRAGRTDRFLFGFWNAANQLGTPEERAAFEQSMSDLMYGRTASVVALRRDYTGSQLNGHYTRIGTEPVVVGRTTVDAVRIRVNFTSAANTGQFWREFWFDPARNLFVQARSSLDYPDQGAWNWNMTSVRPTRPDDAADD